MPLATGPRVRVLLVNYRSEENVEARLASAALADADVVVVDNGSDPARVTELCRQYGATPVLLGDNGGFAVGVNRGWAAVADRPPLPLLLLNPDAELSPAALSTMLHELEQGWDGVGPLLLEAPGRPQVGCGGGPLTLRSVVTYAFRLPGSGLLLSRARARRGGAVSWLCMASLLLAPDALQRYGALPEDEVVYGEDIAWGTRASEAGARFVLVPTAVVPHPHGASGGGHAWRPALERLLRRRLGAVRGRIAILAVRLGLALRASVPRPRAGHT